MFFHDPLRLLGRVLPPDTRLEGALQSRRSSSLPRVRPDMPAAGGADVAAVARMASAMLPRQPPPGLAAQAGPVHRDFSAEVCDAAIAASSSSSSSSSGVRGTGGGCSLEPPAPAEWSAMLQLCAAEVNAESTYISKVDSWITVLDMNCSFCIL